MDRYAYLTILYGNIIFILFKLTILFSIDLDGRSMTLFGRVESCDVRLEHPTISREHAVLQYKPYEEDKELEEGFYLFDLGKVSG